MDFIDAVPVSGGETQPQNIWDNKDHLEVIKHYTDEEGIPLEIREKNWAIFSKAASLTFLDEDDLPMIEMETQIAKLSQMIATPPHLLTFGELENLDQVTVHARNVAKRAVGMKKDKINERISQVTQVVQSISGGQNMSQSRKKFLGLF